VYKLLRPLNQGPFLARMPLMKTILLLLLASFNLSAATVLYVGDSHSVGPFGWALDQNLRDAGHSVATYASCGSIPKWWTNGQKTPCGFFSRDLKGTKVQLNQAPTPIMDRLLADIKPDVVIMEFGGNYLNMPSAEFVKKDIHSFITKVKNTGAQCFWITNPDTRKYREEIPRLAALMKEAIGDECPIFESYLVTRYPETGGDGIHYWNTLGTPIAKAWAQKAFEAFQKNWH
jgi:hypothetical protein